MSGEKHCRVRDTVRFHLLYRVELLVLPRSNASVRNELAVDVEVFEDQLESPLPILPFLDDAEEPERHGGRALERENCGCFLGFCRFAVPVKHQPLLDRDIPVV